MSNKLQNTICFKGGGIKGVAYVGVWKALVEANIAQNVTTFIGTSAGAIFAAGCAFGLTVDQLTTLVLDTNFQKFKDANEVRAGYNIYEYMGEYPGDYFYEWLGDIVKIKHDNPDMTFAQFEPDLIITGTNLTTHQIEYFSKKTTPDMPIRKAIRISMSIPGFFEPVKYNNNWYVDGGCLNNFPVDVHPNTVGFGFREPSKSNATITNIVELISNLVDAQIEEITRLRMSNGPEPLGLVILDIPIDPMDFNVTNAQKLQMIDVGYTTTKKWLA